MLASFAQSDYAQEITDEFPNGPTGDRRGSWFWGPASLVADQPEKVESSRDRPYLRIGPKLKAMMDAAQSEVVLISPYFVPGEEDARYLSGRAQHGVSVKVLTNSLASTDEPAAHSG